MYQIVVFDNIYHEKNDAHHQSACPHKIMLEYFDNQPKQEIVYLVSSLKFINGNL